MTYSPDTLRGGLLFYLDQGLYLNGQEDWNTSTGSFFILVKSDQSTHRSDFKLEISRRGISSCRFLLSSNLRNS